MTGAADRTGQGQARDVRVRPEALVAFTAAVLGAAGVPAPDAQVCAAALVQTDLWGKESHGVMRLPHYVQRIEAGAVNPRPDVRTVRGGGAFEVVDGDDGLGHVVGHAAMQRAMTLAATHGAGVVGVVRSNHFGAASLYVRLAVDQGMVGIAMSNSTPKMIAPGGGKAITGSNPIAVGVPSGGDFPFVVDVSMSAVAGGKLLLAGKKGGSIPDDWALDKEGRPTSDPAAAFAGLWLPIGGAKGLGLSYAVDLLCGLITGGEFGLGVKSQYAHPTEPSGTGHMMIALRLDGVIAPDELAARMRRYMEDVKASPMTSGADEMLVPGEQAHRLERERRAGGIPLSPEVRRELLALAGRLGLKGDLAAEGVSDEERNGVSGERGRS